MSFPGYPSYRESGTKWLGKVPAHWQLKRFKQVFQERDDRSNTGEEELLSVSAYTGVRPRREGIADGEHLSRAETLEGYKQCFPDDLVMNIMLAWNRGLGFSQHEGIVSPAYCVFQVADGSEPRFLDYLLRSDGYIGYFKCFSAGVIDSRLRLYPDAFLSLRTALPPRPEQAAIAAFLDRETAKIDALVEEQRRLIELLKEKRQAVISHAVTKGLDANAPRKDSGVEWLGDVPAHWDVVAVKRAISLATSGPRGWSELASDEGEVFFQSQNIGRQMEIDLADAKRIHVPAGRDAERAKLAVGDVVVCITGGRTGAVAAVRELPETCYINQHVCLLRPVATEVEGSFLAYLLFGRVGQEQLALSMYGLKQGLGLEDVKGVLIALPPLAEQREIVAYLDGLTEQMGELTIEAESAVAFLTERRAALIAAAVTGKIDVRETAKLLPFPVNQARARSLVAAEIIERSAHQATFGRVKLQKIAFLAEAHVGIGELGGSYTREAAGPLDRALVAEMESGARSLAGVEVCQAAGAGTAVTYRLGQERGTHRQELADWLGVDRTAKLDTLISDFAPLTTKGAEAVATLYGVWNDALIEGDSPTDEEIISGFLNSWHEEKREKFRANELPEWLNWMRRHGVVPTGSGPKTNSGRLL